MGLFHINFKDDVVVHLCASMHVFHKNPKEININMDERMTNIELKPVVREEIETVWKMQVEAFSELLERYQDYETSPAT